MSEKFDRKTAAQLREEIEELKLELAFREMEEEVYAQIAAEADEDENLEKWMKENRPQPLYEADKAEIHKAEKKRKAWFHFGTSAYAMRACIVCLIFFLIGSGVGGATVAYVKQAAPEIEQKAGVFGNYLTFGTYEQDNNPENGPEPIEWRVLKVEDNRALVISVHALKLMQYHNTIAEDSSITWAAWDVRAWLNGEFLETAFTESELLRIPTVTVKAQYKRNNTEDQVFLLSIAEAQMYLSGNSSRQCKPTAYAIAEYEAAHGKEWPQNDPWYNDSVAGNCNWWLRSEGQFPGSAADVGRSGVVGVMTKLPEITLNNAGDVDFDYGVRPAMWIDLEP